MLVEMWPLKHWRDSQRPSESSNTWNGAKIPPSDPRPRNAQYAARKCPWLPPPAPNVMNHLVKSVSFYSRRASESRQTVLHQQFDWSRRSWNFWAMTAACSTSRLWSLQDGRRQLWAPLSFPFAMGSHKILVNVGFFPRVPNSKARRTE